MGWVAPIHWSKYTTHTSKSEYCMSIIQFPSVLEGCKQNIFNKSFILNFHICYLANFEAETMFWRLLHKLQVGLVFSNLLCPLKQLNGVLHSLLLYCGEGPLLVEFANTILETVIPLSPSHW